MPSDISSHVVSNPKRVPSVGILIAVSSLSPLAMNIYLPSMSGMMDYFSATAGEIQLTMSLYFIAIAVAQIVLGPLSDQFGRRPVIVGGMALFVVGSILCLLAPTVESLIAARVVQAVGGGTGLVLGRAIVRDMFGREQAASMIGYVTMGMAVAPTIGPAIGGFLDAQYGWQGGFVLMLVFGIGVTIASILYLPETNQHLSHVSIRKIASGYYQLGREKSFWAFCLCAVSTAWLYFAYLGGAPFVAAGVLGLSPPQIGLYFMIVAIGYILGNFITGRVAERVGVVRMIAAGTFIGVFGVSLIVAAVLSEKLNAPLLFLPMLFVGIGNGVCLPSAISGAVSVRPDLAGTASGLTSCLQIGFGSIASIWVASSLSTGTLGDGAMPMVIVMTIGAAASIVFVAAVFFYEKSTRQLPTE
ncbi:MAG: multidrug effflux MFS transporter [Roseibium sp.]